MTRKIVEEDVEVPVRALHAYAAFMLAPAILIRALTDNSGLLESLCICCAASLLVVYCNYYVGRQHKHLRRQFRLRVSALTALGCGILSSDAGLRVRSLDLPSALVFGVCAGVATHFIGLIVSAASDWSLDRIRRFLDPHECRTCGYDLTGNTSGVCPECGVSVPLYQGDRIARANGR